MKRLLGLFLALCLMLSCTSALAVFDFTGTLGNEATFETLEEARISAPLVISQTAGSVAMGNTSAAAYGAHPALDNFPAGTAFVYRSPDIYGGFAAARMNSTFLVVVEQSFADKDEAYAYIETLGLIEIVNQIKGSIVLMTPANGKAFAAADQTNFYNLEIAITALKCKITNDKGVRVTMSDSDYYGTFKNLYVIGIDGGATFLNNYIVSTENMVGRFAGLLLINGSMLYLKKVASLVPTYLVNADAKTIEKYKAANEVDSYKAANGTTVYFNQYLPVRKVVVVNTEEVDVAATIKDAYEIIFKNSMRIQVFANGAISAATPWQNTTGDCAPYSLFSRSVIIDGMTERGTQVIKTVDYETFKDIVTADGEYLTTWYEILPSCIVDGTAADGTIPLILGLAGTGDDPLQYAEEIGLIGLTEEVEVAVVAPGHEGIFEASNAGVDGVEYETMPALINYMLEKYPALDASRVYVTGYSRGGRTTMKVINGCAEILAAAVPMAATQYIPTEEHIARVTEAMCPVMFLTSSADVGTIFDPNNFGVGTGMYAVMKIFCNYNHVDCDFENIDYEAYPISGFAPDSEIHLLLNGEYWNHRFFLNDENGVPMVGVSVTEGLQHALYPSYARLAWDYMEHFSRNLETLEITYTEDPYDF